MSLRDRIGIDVGRRLRLEEALEWAAEHEVRWIDIQLDAGANALSSFDDARAAGVRRACRRLWWLAGKVKRSGCLSHISLAALGPESNRYVDSTRIVPSSANSVEKEKMVRVKVTPLSFPLTIRRLTLQ